MNDITTEIAQLLAKSQFAQLPWHVVITSDVFTLPGAAPDNDTQTVYQECETSEDVIALLRPYVGKHVRVFIFQGRRIPTICYPFALVIDGHRVPVNPEGIGSAEIDPTGSMAIPVAHQKMSSEITEISPDSAELANAFNPGDLKINEDDTLDDDEEEDDDFDGLDEEVDQE